VEIRRLARALAAALVLALGLAACGTSSSPPTTSPAKRPAAAIARNPANAKVTLTVGSKNFTEAQVLGEIYAQAFQAAGYTVRKALDLGDENVALKALRDGRISGYPEYTGTILLSFLDVPAARLPHDARRAYDQARAGMAKLGIVALPASPFTDSNAVGLLAGKARELGVTTISDLRAKAAELTLYGSPECRARRDCLLGLKRTYGLRFKRFVPVDLAHRHQVLASGLADVSIVFTTDPQVKRAGEVLLRDDKHLFGPNNPTFLVSREVADKAGPDLAATVGAVNRDLTASVMQELNARVDLDKDTPEQAARAYLKQFQLIPS
jgi:osmoprotectant transport system substrate-binding protein